MPGNVTSRNSRGSNTLFKPGAKLTATWDDVWEELPAAVKLEHESERGAQASHYKPEASSLFGNDDQLSPKERKILAVLRQDESIHIDTIMERVEGDLSSPRGLPFCSIGAE